MFESCLKKQKEVVALFSHCATKEGTYEKLILLGRELAQLPVKERLPEYLVRGCQSMTYLTSRFENGAVFFSAASDALISAGLAALLIRVYSGEAPETVLKCPPQFLDDLGISTTLTPSRANGLYSMHLRMKQDALKLF